MQSNTSKVKNLLAAATERQSYRCSVVHRGFNGHDVELVTSVARQLVVDSADIPKYLFEVSRVRRMQH